MSIGPNECSREAGLEFVRGVEAQNPDDDDRETIDQWLAGERPTNLDKLYNRLLDATETRNWMRIRLRRTAHTLAILTWRSEPMEHRTHRCHAWMEIDMLRWEMDLQYKALQRLSSQCMWRRVYHGAGSRARKREECSTHFHGHEYAGCKNRCRNGMVYCPRHIRYVADRRLLLRARGFAPPVADLIVSFIV